VPKSCIKALCFRLSTNFKYSNNLKSAAYYLFKIKLKNNNFCWSEDSGIGKPGIQTHNRKKKRGISNAIPRSKQKNPLNFRLSKA